MVATQPTSSPQSKPPSQGLAQQRIPNHHLESRNRARHHDVVGCAWRYSKQPLSSPTIKIKAPVHIPHLYPHSISALQHHTILKSYPSYSQLPKKAHNDAKRNTPPSFALNVQDLSIYETIIEQDVRARNIVPSRHRQRHGGQGYGPLVRDRS